MTSGNDKDLDKIKKLLAWYNMIPNLIWSILNLAPISIFCFTAINLKVFYIFLVVSLMPIFLKNSFLDKLQIGKTTTIYKKLGVHIINNVAQNGAIINRLIKKKFPQYKVVKANTVSISRLINKTYLFEKFHLISFIFFSLTTIYAIAKNRLSWACIIFLTNIVYNIYPNLLQQYIRLKLKIFSKKSANNF